MKFKDMSYNELMEDFKKVLDKYTDKELIKSLEEYMENWDGYYRWYSKFNLFMWKVSM